MKFSDRLKHGWNALTSNTTQTPPNQNAAYNYGPITSYRSDRVYRTLGGGDRSILASIYTRIAIDVASVAIRHIRTDDQGRYAEDMKSMLNERLNLEANLDQGARAFRQDIAQTLFDEGVVAIVPVEVNGDDPALTASFDVKELRVGKIVNWHPAHVRVSLYNQKTGQREEVTLLKRTIAIVENPLYNVMNEPNGTLKRLTRKLTLLDSVDEQTSNGKLDMIIQLPYSIRTPAKQDQATMRRNNLEEQLKDSKYGIGYIDATEKITQLNRPLENNMLKQVEYLMGMLYSQLGISEEVFKGTATADQMLNYQNRTVEPILSAIVEAMRRSFISRTARTQGQTIEFFQDPFKLLPIDKIAEIADKFTRNEIMTSNEFRGKLGLPPSTDPKADQLTNSNLYGPGQSPGPESNAPAADTSAPEGDDSDFDSMLSQLESSVMSTIDGAGSDAQ